MNFLSNTYYAQMWENRLFCSLTHSTNPRAENREGNCFWKKEVNLQNFAELVTLQSHGYLQFACFINSKDPRADKSLMLSICCPNGANVPTLATGSPYWIIVYEVACHFLIIALSVLSSRVLSSFLKDYCMVKIIGNKLLISKYFTTSFKFLINPG